MAHRTRKQALVPIAIGAILAGAICVGVASIPERVRTGTPTAVSQRVADASVAVRTKRHKGYVTYTVRIGNAGPDATGRLGLRAEIPTAFATRSKFCGRTGRILECDWPKGLEPGTSLSFTLSTRKRTPLFLPLTSDATDWSPANNTVTLR